MRTARELTRRDAMRMGLAAGTATALAASSATATSAATTTSRPAAGDPWLGLKVGIASYTFKEFPVDATIAAIQRLGLSYVSIKDFHLPMNSTAEQRREVARKLRDAKLTPLSCGVVNLSDDPAQQRNAFEYARDAGIPTIVCKPTRASLPALERLVKEFDIRLAIHNHGPEDKVWPSPFDVWDAIQALDARVGLCIDVGHTARCAVDPAAAIRRCASRLYDVHVKDLASNEGRSQPVEVGRGVLDVRGILAALREIGFTHHVGLEHEKDMKDPMPGVAESIGYIRGVLACQGDSSPSTRGRS